MSQLEVLRIITFVLGAFGMPFALQLLQISHRVMISENRRSSRYVATLFFGMGIGILFALSGSAGVSLCLIITKSTQSLLPAYVLIGTNAISDILLFGMSFVSKVMDSERRNR